MTHQKNGAFIIGDYFLQQIQCFKIKVIGRFVEHQQIGHACKFARQQQPGLLAPRQGTDPGIDQGRSE